MIVFVTGASAGFGAALARAFVKGGHRVIGAARRKKRLLALVKELGDDLLPIELDVRDRAAVESLASWLPAEFAAVDVLVAYAGLALGMEPALRALLDDWQAMIDTNCTGLVQVTRAFLAGIDERNCGHVFNRGGGRRSLALPQRECLWCNQGIFLQVQPELARGPDRNRNPRDRYRTGTVWRNRVF